MAKRPPRSERAVDVWSRVRMELWGREVLGTVIEDRGLLGVGGTKLWEAKALKPVLRA